MAASKRKSAIMSKSKKTALGGLVTALASVIMISSNIIPLGLYAFPALAGIIIYILSFSAGNSYAWSAYTAVSIISFIICTDKEAVLCFIFFLGYYPIIKVYFEKIKLKIIGFILKLAVFNVAVIIIYAILTFVFAISTEQFEIFGINVPILIFILFNIIFVLYDYALGVFIKRYGTFISKIVTKMFK